MAEKRMFSSKVTETDVFLSMPLSTQALYFHLNMNADDEGFVDKPRIIMRMINASEDDMNLLITKRYILVFDSGIVVVKHWKLHNRIRKDRVTETDYIEERKLLGTKENGAYTRAFTDCQPDVNQVPAECPPSIEEYSIEEYSIYTSELKEIFLKYFTSISKRFTTKKVTEKIKVLVKNKENIEDIKKGFENYIKSCVNESTRETNDITYIKDMMTFLNQEVWKDFLGDIEYSKLASEQNTKRSFDKTTIGDTSEWYQSAEDKELTDEEQSEVNQILNNL